MGRLVAAASCVVLAIGCYSPPHPDCGFICGPGGACPSTYFCATDNRCHGNGTAVDLVCLDAGNGMIDADLSPPAVFSTSPNGGDSNVPRTTVMTATFTQDVMGVSAATMLCSHAFQPGIMGAISYDPASLTATFTPAALLPAGMPIMVELTGGIANHLNVPLPDTTWTFTTIDDEPPTLASSAPLDMATMVPINTTITVQFSEAVQGIDTTSFTVAQGVTAIPGTIAVSLASAVFTPTAVLPPASTITVTLSAGISDFAGNALVPTTFSFMTQ